MTQDPLVQAIAQAITDVALQSESVEARSARVDQLEQICKHMQWEKAFSLFFEWTKTNVLSKKEFLSFLYRLVGFQREERETGPLQEAITDTAQPLNEAFTRQHYIAIAKIIKDSNSWGGHGDEAAAQRDAINKTMKLVAAEFVDLFREDNPAFDRARFYSACGF